MDLLTSSIQPTLEKTGQKTNKQTNKQNSLVVWSLLDFGNINCLRGPCVLNLQPKNGVTLMSPDPTGSTRNSK